MSGGETELLQWARGPGFVLAIAVFVFGVVLRLFEILGLGRQADLSEAREKKRGSGWQTILSRSFNFSVFNPHTALNYIVGYVFHLGLFACILLLIPHIELIRGVLGFGWPGLPTPLVDAIAVVTLLAMLVKLVDRVTSPVKRLLSTWGDYLAWLLTFLPLLSGYLAYHHLLWPYPTMLALHILSAELLLALLPFTRLMHAFTLFFARWYNGEIFSRKGVAS